MEASGSLRRRTPGVLVFLVIAGLLAMHGFSSQHDMAMPGAGSPMRAPGSNAALMTGMDSPGDPGQHAVPGADSGDVAAQVQADGGGMGGAMDVCVAVLTLLVLLMLSRPARARMARIRGGVPNVVHRNASWPPSPAGPSLIRLCVARV